MHEPFICLGLGRRFHSAIYLAALSLLVLSQIARGEPAPTVADIRAAWQARFERINSYEYGCEITETLFNIKRYAAFDPTSGSLDGDPATGEIILPRINVGKTMMFRRAGSKTAYRLSGERWDHQRELRTYSSFTTTFDGKQISSLFEDRIIAARFTSTTTPEMFHVQQGVFYLWHSPVEMLERLAFRTRNMMISKPQVSVDERECVELTIPRSNHRWKVLLDVDPARDYLPVRFRMTLDGVVTSDSTIRYAKDAAAGWVVASWNESRFTEEGHPESFTKSTVTGATINQPNEDHVFSIELPVGTRVTQKDGDKTSHFLVLPGGERRPIDAAAMGEFKDTDKRFINLRPRIKAIGAITSAERDELLADLQLYVRDPASSRPKVWELVESTAQQLHSSAGPEAAIAFCRKFTGESEVCRQCLPRMATAIEAQQRRAKLIGRKIELTGNSVDGNPFDWTPLAGKTVLVDFWFTGCAPCHQDLPWLKQLYDAHHDNGFAVVGVSVDTDPSVLTKFLGQEQIPWPTIHEPEQIPDTNTVRYDVHSFPTYILIDRTGKVIFAGSRNDELQNLLHDLLNP